MNKFTQKLAFFTLILVVLTAAISACVKKPATPVANQNQNTNAATNAENLITLTKDADGWKTYTNKDWGISFRFEDKNDEITISGDKPTNLDDESNYIQLISKNSSELLRLYRGSFSDIYPIANNLEEYIVEHGNWPDAPSVSNLDRYEPIEVDAATGYRAYVIICRGSSCGELEFIYLNYSKETKYERYDFLEFDGTGSEDKTIFNQILETFQFLN